MTPALDDQQARDDALDPGRSFIVQAPAGSGKTELLIQRYLRLLTVVREPEQIVAITFTRKAAAEMRSRVLRALHAAASPEAVAHSHQARTLSLAREAVAQDRTLGWSLQSQPQRMRIETLDALNAWLAHQLPVLSGGVAGARVTEDASRQHREAARRTVRRLAEHGTLGTSIAALARELDGDLGRLETLFAELLPKRDQWLRYLAGSDLPALRRELEHALRRLVVEALDELADLWPERLLPGLIGSLRHAARFADDDALREALAPWLGQARAPRGLAAVRAWQAAARILLTQRGEWRRKLLTAHGFGGAHTAPRAALRGLLEQLRASILLRDALAATAALPDPRYSDRQWASLAALKTVLTHLAAELKVVFAEQQCVDFVELALGAQAALGRTEAPSELLLALDHRIQHILVDEFQDTSHSQLRLLQLLTAGWQPGDGRSLFLVGDPMQSIYRFRDADMPLFLKAKQRGVGTVACTSLTLDHNFRSSPKIVEWVNRVFSTVFPADDDISTGTAGFRPCRATRVHAEDHGVRVHALRTDDGRAELAQVMRTLEHERARAPEQALAVLVQSRSHLSGLHEHLVAKGWPVHAVEIDALNEHQVGQDLLGLTRALTHLGDRVAWLGVLRAPWCGLGWADLHGLCHADPRTVWALARDPTRLEGLSADGRQRLAWVAAVLAKAFERRGNSRSLARWVEATWIALRGPACLDREEELAIADRFFSVLAREEHYGDLDDPASLEAAFSDPQRYADSPRESGIEIMTIHRAKGLEFDTVVLVGLGREPPRADPKILHWMERTSADGGDDLIMAPLGELGDEADRLTRFLKDAERRRDTAERARLLYVASTRARDRLHLVCRMPPRLKQPPATTLLAHLWPSVGALFEQAPGEQPPAAASAEPESLEPRLRRLADGFRIAAGLEGAPETAAAPPAFEWAGRTAVQVGTVVHGWAQRIAEEGVHAWPPDSIEHASALYRRELELLGVEGAELAAATARVTRALRGMLEDPRGRWVLAPHAEARSELRLALHTARGLEHLRLDRTFVEDGTRWIVDLKTGEHEGADREAFLDSEVERYRAQLETYAAAMSRIDARPVRVGLYFPLLRAFRSWAPTPVRGPP